MAIDIWRRRLAELSELVAMFGGLVLSGIALLVVYAVVVAKLGSPLLGDTEIVEFAAAVAVFSFMPYCQMKQGHVAVTVFTSKFPMRYRHVLDVAAHGIMTAVIIILCWRLFAGGVDAFSRNQVSMFLQLPAWWAYALITLPCLLWMVTSAFITLQSALRVGGDEPGSQAGEKAA